MLCVVKGFLIHRCRRVQLAVTRVLFLLQDSGSGRGLTANSTLRHQTFHHLLIRGKELPLFPEPHPLVTLKRGKVWFENSTEVHVEGYTKGRTHIAFPLPTGDHTPLQLVAASNTVSMLYACVCLYDACVCPQGSALLAVCLLQLTSSLRLSHLVRA